MSLLEQLLKMESTLKQSYINSPWTILRANLESNRVSYRVVEECKLDSGFKHSRVNIILNGDIVEDLFLG